MHFAMSENALMVLPGFSVSALSPEGGLAAYIRRVNAAPMLTAAEEKQYADSYRQSGDVESARALALSHLRLVVALARKYSGYGLDQGDIIQEGNIGLLNAIKRFDPSMGARLATFATFGFAPRFTQKSPRPKHNASCFFILGGCCGTPKIWKLHPAMCAICAIRNTNLLHDGGALDTAHEKTTTHPPRCAAKCPRSIRMEMLDSSIYSSRKLSENPRPLRELADQYGERATAIIEL